MNLCYCNGFYLLVKCFHFNLVIIFWIDNFFNKSLNIGNLIFGCRMYNINLFTMSNLLD